MKLSVVLFVVLVAYVCADDGEEAHKKRMQEVTKKCLKEAGTTIEEIQKCHNEKKECPKMNCFDACALREDGLIDKDGTVIAKTIEQYVTELGKHGHPKSAAAMKKCCQNPKKKMSFCDIGHAIVVCMEKEPHD